MFWSFSCIEMALWTKYDELKPAVQEVEKYQSFKSLLNWAATGQLLPEVISADAIRKLRYAMAHPRHFNIVMFPGTAFDCFDLLVRIIGRLWPATERAKSGVIVAALDHP